MTTLPPVLKSRLQFWGLATFALALLLTASADCGSAPVGDALKQFQLENGKFKVLLPGRPEVATHKSPNGSAMTMYTATLDVGVFTVVTLPIIPAAKEAEDKLQTRLDTGRDQAIQNSKGKLAKESRIQLAGKYPGREIVIEMPDGKEFVRDRFYLVQGYLIQLIATGPSDMVDSPTSNKFLDSLSLGK